MHAPSLIVQAFDRLTLALSVVTLVGITGGAALLNIVSWWVAVVVLLVYGLMWSIYDKFDEVRADNEMLSGQLTTSKKRRVVKNLLGEAQAVGHKLDYESSRPEGVEKERVHRWVDSTRDLIVAAFDEGEAQLFLSNKQYRHDELDKQFSGDASGLRHTDIQPQYRVGARLRRLDELIVRMDALEINPDFDARDWEGRFILE